MKRQFIDDQEYIQNAILMVLEDLQSSIAANTSASCSASVHDEHDDSEDNSSSVDSMSDSESESETEVRTDSSLDADCITVCEQIVYHDPDSLYDRTNSSVKTLVEEDWLADNHAPDTNNPCLPSLGKSNKVKRDESAQTSVKKHSNTNNACFPKRSRKSASLENEPHSKDPSTCNGSEQEQSDKPEVHKNAAAESHSVCSQPCPSASISHHQRGDTQDKQQSSRNKARQKQSDEPEVNKNAAVESQSLCSQPCPSDSVSHHQPGDTQDKQQSSKSKARHPRQKTLQERNRKSNNSCKKSLANNWQVQNVSGQCSLFDYKEEILNQHIPVHRRYVLQQVSMLVFLCCIFIWLIIFVWSSLCLLTIEGMLVSRTELVLYSAVVIVPAAAAVVAILLRC